MTTKYRVNEVAKDLRMQSKEIIALFNEWGDASKKSQTALEERELDRLFERLTGQHQIADLDVYFKQAESRRAAARAKEQAAAEEKRAAAEKLAAEKAAEKAAKDAAAKAASAEAKPATSTPAAKPARPPEEKAPAAKPAAPAPAAKPAASAPAAKPAAPAAQPPAPKAEKLPKPSMAVRRPIQPAVAPGVQAAPQQPKTPKTPGEAPRRAPQERRTVDTRTSQVNLGKYDEKFDTLAQSANRAKVDSGPTKQKFSKRPQQGRRPAKRETENERLRRIAMERKQKHMVIEVGDTITVGELALRMKATGAEVVKKLFATMGVMATVNEEIDYETAYLVAEEFHVRVEREVVVTIEERIIDDSTDTDDNLMTRDPVVVVMGHVDHGKTSILDAIRQTSVIEGEAGGITQHIGAYRVDVGGQGVTFLDTPGHAAFTSMRARGANITDIAILVVAADDGIMPQTIEAIHHAKAAGVSIIVAINKMDKPEANPEKVMQQLTEHELVPEEWGGDAICVPVSAKTGQGLDKLLETVLLVAEVRELKANPDRAAKGSVVEARLDKGRGPIATVLVQNGTLRAGDIIVAGTAVGRVRAMADDRGRVLEEAGPSVPVEIMGLDSVPVAGDIFNAVTDERLARELVEQRRHSAREEIWGQQQKVTLDNLFEQMQAGELKELSVIVKADVQGSVEAVRQSLEKLQNDEVRVRVIHGAVGAISENDVMLAEASGAIIVGFNVRPEPLAQTAADNAKVDMRMYRIIYDIIEEIGDAMKGMLAPKYREVLHGTAEVRQVFRITGVGVVAGCYVQKGKVYRNDLLRIVRDGIIIADDKMTSLKRFKDDQREVAESYECGIGLEKFTDLKEGDIFETYIIEEYRD